MIEIRRRGVASVVICSEPFVRLGRTQSRVLGVPDLPLIIIPHPLGGVAMSDVKARADAALAQLLVVLREHALGVELRGEIPHGGNE
jgi:hypothetical protein